MDHFTPVSALAGGMLIGGSAALILILNGRVAGVSGILGGLVPPSRGDISWRIAFLVGLLLAPVIYGAFGGAIAPVTVEASVPVLALAGFLVGFGTRLGA